jgi:hypothetical protein
MNDARAETIRLAELLRRERHAMAEFLVALSAFDAGRRWEELGYASLFDFLRRELKLSAGAAQNRKAAAGLIARFPEVEAALRRGELCLSSASQVAKVLTPENAAEVLPRFFGKSARDAELVAASIRPVEDPPRREFLVTAVRANPNREASGGPVLEMAGVAPDAVNLTSGAFHACETTSAAAAPPLAPATTGGPWTRSAGSSASTRCPPVAIPDRPRIKPLDAERARVNMTVSRRLLDKLAAARDALTHSHPGASEETILELGLDLIIDRHRKRRGIGAKPRKRGDGAADAPAPVAASVPAPVAASGPVPVVAGSAPGPTASAPEVAGSAAAGVGAHLTSGRVADSAGVSRATTHGGGPAETQHATTALVDDDKSEPPPPPPPRDRSRHVPAAVWRGVWERDQGRCVWPLENGGVCGSTYRLELDHVGGAALGAGTSVDGCRLLCKGHNLLHARALYGDAVMDRYLRPTGGPRSAEPVAAYGAGLDERTCSVARTAGRPEPGSSIQLPGQVTHQGHHRRGGADVDEDTPAVARTAGPPDRGLANAQRHLTAAPGGQPSPSVLLLRPLLERPRARV